MYQELGWNEAYSDLDYQNVSLIYYYCKTGCIISMALKFAGTGNDKLRRIIFEYLEEIQRVKINPNIFLNGAEVKGMLDEYSLNIVRTMTLVSLSIVMAGHCDSMSGQMIKDYIRSLKTNQTLKSNLYGFQQMLQMALGFVYLKKGTMTFGSSDF